jgi:hypothetical protein
VLASPYTSAPAGAVVIPAGDDSSIYANDAGTAPRTTYWFAPGVHTVGSGLGNEIQAQDGDTFIGAPGAIINGQGLNSVAFDASTGSGPSSGVTVEYLTIENFTAGSSGDGEAAVDHDLGANWTIKYDTVEDNAGVGITIGSNSVVEYNCIINNGETGLQSYTSSNLTISDNEVSYNDSAGKYDQAGSADQCGCAGGIKLLETTGAQITDNYVHNNGDVGIWLDTDNTGINISGNYISGNYNEGIQYEISYNGQITDNTLVENALGGGPVSGTKYGNVMGAIYISQSGSDPRAGSTYGSQFLVSGNDLIDNWDGIILYDNSGRVCGTSGVACTLVAPSLWDWDNTSTCSANLDAANGGNPDYWDLCRWKTNNVKVTANVFSFNPATIDAALPAGTAQCTAANFCGYNGLYAFNAGGTYQPPGCSTGNSPPFACQTSDSVNVSYDWGNSFSDNTYYGPWQFWAFNQGDVDDWAAWTGGLSQCSQGQYACTSGFGQDSGSTYASTGGPWWDAS